MFVVDATRTVLDRLHEPVDTHPPASTTILGCRYATVLSWRPQVALFVNETTLFPVLFPFAPSKTMIDRFPASLAAVLDAFGAGTEFIDREIDQMNEHRLSKTVNRSTVGMLNEFAFLAGVHTRSTGAGDLINMSLRLSTTP